jgi:hypothetical protein
MLVSWVAQV